SLIAKLCLAGCGCTCLLIRRPLLTIFRMYCCVCRPCRLIWNSQRVASICYTGCCVGVYLGVGDGVGVGSGDGVGGGVSKRFAIGVDSAAPAGVGVDVVELGVVDANATYPNITSITTPMTLQTAIVLLFIFNARSQPNDRLLSCS
ncbi:MAG: hypothetical protein ACXVIW_07805, partial [Halobacteriota archaeon]